MALRTVKWASMTCLSCKDCDGAEVILCIDPAKVLAPECPEQEAMQPYPYSTIDAVLIKSCPLPSGTPGKALMEYTFSYDDAQLPSGVLYSSEINGAFCKGCLTSWTEQLVGNEPHIREEEEGSYTFVSPHGCEYPFQVGGGCVNVIPTEFLFGNGADGDLTVLDTEDIILPYPRNFYFNDLTIDEGGTLYPVGTWLDYSPGNDNYYWIQIFVNGTLTINGTLSASGENGGDGVGSSGVGNNRGFYTEGLQFLGEDVLIGPGGWYDYGGSGGWGQRTAGGPNHGFSAAANLNPGNAYQAGGDGGRGGDGGGGVSLGGLTEGYGAPYKPEKLIFGPFIDFSSGGSYIGSVIGGGVGAGGGGGGSRTGTAEGGMGGGGGASGASICVFARNVVIGSNGILRSNGGDGGDGADGIAGGGGDDGDGGGGGGGAGGGVVYLVYKNLINNGLIEALGGNGGVGGSGVGPTAENGDVGSDGVDGNLYLLNMTTGRFE